MNPLKLASCVLISSALLTLQSAAAQTAPNTLLNASYDIARDLYKDYNLKFAAQWKAKTGQALELKQSHAGSTKQVRAVADGLEADVVTMNQATDIAFLASQGLVSKDWTKKFPNNASPYTSTAVLIVRSGNPKGITDWDDLAKPDIKVIFSNPKSSGTGRYAYLAAWGWAKTQPSGSDKTAAQLMSRLLKNVPILPTGGRDATSAFIQRGQGDVLISLEGEAELIAREFGRGKFDVIYPSASILAEFPVAIVEKTADKHGTRQLAQAYLDYLWSPEGQEIIASNYLRPRDGEALKKHAAQFPAIPTFTVEQAFGSWENAFNQHFKDGGTFDQAYQKR